MTRFGIRRSALNSGAVYVVDGRGKQPGGRSPIVTACGSAAEALTLARVMNGLDEVAWRAWNRLDLSARVICKVARRRVPAPSTGDAKGEVRL